MGVEIRVEGITKSFGRQTIWEDVTFTIPSGEISVLLGPSGTGKSVFLKSLIGLLKPNTGSIHIDGHDITRMKEGDLYETRKLFGVLFQDGALFGSQSLFDNIAFPLREHTRKREGEIKSIVMEKVEMVGLLGAEGKLPGEISGGMRKRAGLARALVLDPEIILCDEPDSGLDPVRTAFLNQLIVDLNQQIEATFLIVTHDINTARSLPDNIGLLYRRHLAMFGPRLQLLTSPEPVVRQFLNGQREGPIGMAEEKDAAVLAAEAEAGGKAPDLPPLQPQLRPSNGESRPSMRGPLLTRSAPVDEVRSVLTEMAAGNSDGDGLFEKDDQGKVIGAERIDTIVNTKAAAIPGAPAPVDPNPGHHRDNGDRAGRGSRNGRVRRGEPVPTAVRTATGADALDEDDDSGLQVREPVGVSGGDRNDGGRTALRRPTGPLAVPSPRPARVAAEVSHSRPRPYGGDRPHPRPLPTGMPVPGPAPDSSRSTPRPSPVGPRRPPGDT